jgi:hypothetical protein
MLHFPDGSKIDFPAGLVSDGYHTFDELYAHRSLLFIALMHSHPKISWAAKLHADGTMYEGFFVAGIELATGRITYHLHKKYWERLPNSYTGFTYREIAPTHDGHTSQDVIERLANWCGTSAGNGMFVAGAINCVGSSLIASETE